MTDKKLKVGNTAYTELSIQIGVLEAKVDKVLQLLLEQQKPYIINNDFVGIAPLEIKSLSSVLEETRANASELFRDLVTNEKFDREFK